VRFVFDLPDNPLSKFRPTVALNQREAHDFDLLAPSISLIADFTESAMLGGIHGLRSIRSIEDSGMSIYWVRVAPHRALSP
jgi:hypothetical protein